MSNQDRPLPGHVYWPEPGLRMILAPNPSPMTLYGTNSYILGEGHVAVIDPGPQNPAHLAALLAALKPHERVTHIFVTHAHLDHSPLARPLAEATGAPVLAFGDAVAGRSTVMTNLAKMGGIEGGEGVDADFFPDIHLKDGDSITTDGWTIDALHTPGHFGNHLCFRWGDRVFCGDHVMGWASSLVSPPDGDMGAYMASLNQLAKIRATRLYSGHGGAIEDPATRIADLLAHRRGRETAILAALSDGPSDAVALAHRIYTDTPATLMRAAARNVMAHLIDLSERNLIRPEGILCATARFQSLSRL
ncbi:MAG: MBL fold metallo-hydrolase [Albidovulum sp.]